MNISSGYGDCIDGCYSNDRGEDAIAGSMAFRLDMTSNPIQFLPAMLFPVRWDGTHVSQQICSRRKTSKGGRQRITSFIIRDVELIDIVSVDGNI